MCDDYSGQYGYLQANVVKNRKTPKISILEPSVKDGKEGKGNNFILQKC